jgi:hypothetical protein
MRIFHRQRPQQCPIDHREHRGVRTNPQCQRHDRRDGEQRRANQTANDVAKFRHRRVLSLIEAVRSLSQRGKMTLNQTATGAVRLVISL